MKNFFLGLFVGIAICTVPVSLALNPDFIDIEKGHWYEEAINKMSAIGVISGYDDGTFKPAEFATRAEIVTMLDRLKNYVDTSYVPFPLLDVDRSSLDDDDYEDYSYEICQRRDSSERVYLLRWIDNFSEEDETFYNVWIYEHFRLFDPSGNLIESGERNPTIGVNNCWGTTEKFFRSRVNFDFTESNLAICPDKVIEYNAEGGGIQDIGFLRNGSERHRGEFDLKWVGSNCWPPISFPSEFLD